MSIMLADNERRGSTPSRAIRPRTVSKVAGQEYYRTLASRLSLGASSRAGRQLVGVTSCSKGAGVTTVVHGLGMAVADAHGGEALLVDTRLARPDLTRRCAARVSPGLYDTDHNALDLESATQTVPGTSLKLLSPGKNTQPAQLAVDDIVEHWKARYDLILIDLPPRDDWHTVVPLLTILDGVVLVIESERTSRDELHQTHLALQQLKVTTIGAVLNKQRSYLPRWLRCWF